MPKVEGRLTSIWSPIAIITEVFEHLLRARHCAISVLLLFTKSKGGPLEGQRGKQFVRGQVNM